MSALTVAEDDGSKQSPVQAPSPMNVDQRAAAIAEEIRNVSENKVLYGPFEGLILPDIRGNGSPFYLGTYEHELHDVLRQIISGPYRNIFNAGCSFGYYAAGLARAMPEATVYASDIDEKVLLVCEHVKQENKLDNLKISRDWFTGGDLIIMDIEGAEDELLHVGDYDVLVESHECLKPGLTQRLIDRFSNTHNIDLIHNNIAFVDLQQIFPGRYIEHFDHAIATWEGRAGPTPWLWMVRKEKQMYKNGMAFAADSVKRQTAPIQPSTKSITPPLQKSSFSPYRGNCDKDNCAE